MQCMLVFTFQVAATEDVVIIIDAITTITKDIMEQMAVKMVQSNKEILSQTDLVSFEEKKKKILNTLNLFLLLSPWLYNNFFMHFKILLFSIIQIAVL